MNLEPALWRYTYNSRPAEVERAFRDHFLDNDIKQLTVSVYAIAVVLIGMIFLDGSRLAEQPGLLPGFIIKFIFLFLGLSAPVVAKKYRKPIIIDLSVLAYTSMYVIGILYAYSVNDYSPARMFAVTTVFIFVSHIALPVYAAYLLPAVVMFVGGESYILYASDRMDLVDDRPFMVWLFLFAAVISQLASALHQRSRYGSFRALQEVKTLSGFLPICANCKKIRDDDGFYQEIERYISKRTDAIFSHGICPDCASELYGYHHKGQREKPE